MIAASLEAQVDKHAVTAVPRKVALDQPDPQLLTISSRMAAEALRRTALRHTTSGGTSRPGRVPGNGCQVLPGSLGGKAAMRVVAIALERRPARRRMRNSRMRVT